MNQLIGFKFFYRSLSGGELARVELAKLLLKRVNFLLMDKPTNHLDIASREALETALSDYDGTMLRVSHDRYFINKLADRILYLTSNGIIEYQNYADYLAHRHSIPTEKKKEEQEKRDKEEKELHYKERKRIIAEKRKILNRCSKVEELVEATEKKNDELIQECDNSEISSDYVKLGKISIQIDKLRCELDEYMKEWETLQKIFDKDLFG